MSEIFTCPSVLFQGITFTALRVGQYPLIHFTTGGVAGHEVVTMDSSNNIYVQVNSGVSTTAQVITAIMSTVPSGDGLAAGNLVSMVNTTPGVVTAPGTSSAMTGAIVNGYSPQVSTLTSDLFIVRASNVGITTDISSYTTLAIVPTTGLYAVSAYAVATADATGTDVPGSLVIGWTDETGGQALTFLTLGATAGSAVSFTAPLHALAGSVIKFYTNGSSGPWATLVENYYFTIIQL